jgi:hypothetical protein
VFVTGHSYATAGFSTVTEILDAETGASRGQLEEFAVFRDGQPFRAADFNFWGVTFAADSDRFYATLSTGGRIYLVAGEIGARRLTVVGEDVECPSLSPDGNRLAFKKRTTSNGRTMWRLAVLELRSRKETVLAERRNVDDQAEWLDDRTVAYGLPDEAAAGRFNLWSVPADGTGTPRRLMEAAESPSVVPTTPRVG